MKTTVSRMFGTACRVLALGVLITSVLAAPAAQAADEYDYIVVGSGPGGGPLASNLARAGFSVLLLEAGDDSEAVGGSQYPPSVTWDFFVKHYEDEERTMMYNHLVWKTVDGSYWVGKGSDTPPADSTFLGVYYPRGGTLGGSSMINAMATWLPADRDWDLVTELTGDESWRAENMRKFFERMESNNYVPDGTEGHGFDGYFQTNLPPVSVSDPVLAVFQSIAESMGLDPDNVEEYLGNDPNGLVEDRDTTEGIWGLPAHTNRNGQRFSSRHYVQATIEDGFPLTLETTALATKVLFDESGEKPKATGVEYLFGKSVYRADARYSDDNPKTKKTATAKNEVILSGGCFNTPQLLMLSGIGPREGLEQFDIPVLVDLPGVGRNLMDNQEMPNVGRSKTNGFGGGNNAVMIKTKHAAYDERDIMLFQGAYAFRGFWPANQTNEDLEIDPAMTYGISICKNHPMNTKGYVKLRSADPQDMPEINFMLYEEGAEYDLEAIKDTVAWARKVYENVEAPSGPIEPIEPPCPGGWDEEGYCENIEDDENWIVGQTFGHHPTSTAKIGADDDPMSVLNSKFQVRGVDSLRVVDASAFPRIPGVFPVVATFMISEKATDTILESVVVAEK